MNCFMHETRSSLIIPMLLFVAMRAIVMAIEREMLDWVGHEDGALACYGIL